MAVGGDEHGDNLERDARLARLLEVAGDEAPPAALNEAILAAARRAVYAQPQAAEIDVRGSAPRVHAKRNWYAPVSLAAVLLLSVGLVTLVYKEKGDELVQPTQNVSAPTAATVPDSETASVAPLQLDKPKTLAQTERRNPEMRDNAPAQTTIAKDQAGAHPPEFNSARSEPDSAQKRQAPNDKAEVMAQSAEAVAKSLKPARPPSNDSANSASPARARDEAAGAAAPSATPSASRSAPAPADAVAPSRSAPTQELGAAAVQGRSAPTPTPAGEPAAQSADAQQPPRPAWLVELDNQPPDKWLAQLAAFRRDARVFDADTLLAEFRRRFPDHPASAR